MIVNGKHYRTIWMEGTTVFMIDQNALPFKFRIYQSKTCTETCNAIRTMITRGAGAIGAAAGFAMAQAFAEAAESGKGKAYFDECRRAIENTRPTARDLFYATGKVYSAGIQSQDLACYEALKLADANIDAALGIAEAGKELIHDGMRILTHCNAGWLGFVDWGSALAPIYKAHREGKKLYVFVDETRPRSQGARLTAWELHNEGIPHSIIPDNAVAHLMQKRMIDMVITGADRIAANGDAANKIGTLEKAILAREFGVPFYVAAPLSTFDLTISDGQQIPIEERPEDEIHYIEGPDENGIIRKIRVTNPGSAALNPAFDVTPAEFITGIVTEKGISKNATTDISKLFFNNNDLKEI